MSFQDVYRNEVLVSRRTRSQRAHFWAKVIGVVLMVVIGATLRSEPQLRNALFTAGMDGVASAAGQRDTASAEQPYRLPDVSQMKASLTQSENAANAAPIQTKVVARPRDAVRVNRHGATRGLSGQFQSVQPAAPGTMPSAADADAAKAIAADLGKLLQAMKPGH